MIWRVPLEIPELARKQVVLDDSTGLRGTQFEGQVFHLLRRPNGGVADGECGYDGRAWRDTGHWVDGQQGFVNELLCEVEYPRNIPQGIYRGNTAICIVCARALEARILNTPAPQVDWRPGFTIPEDYYA